MAARLRAGPLAATVTIMLAVLHGAVPGAAQTVLPEIVITAPKHKPAAPKRKVVATRKRAPSPPAVQPPAPSPPVQPPPAPEPAPAADLVAITPIAGSEIARDKIPANVQTLGASDFAVDKTPNLIDALVRGLPGVSTSDQAGNPYQINIDYRGFTASPVPGTPQGIAVYQNGVRINEAYGDVINWSFIPERAIERLTLMPNNPVFGLNAIGGALSMQMKNGFVYHGTELEALGGSFGRISAGAQSGGQNGNVAAYVAADAVSDQGWRDFSSFSQLRRIYADLGGRGEQTELHLMFTGADNYLGAVVATPVELLNRRWSAVYTWPQTTRLQLAFLEGAASYQPSDVLSIQGLSYLRWFRQAHVDGNNSDAQPCAIPSGFLCIGDGFTPINQNFPVPDTLPPGAFFGEIDRNWTATTSYGGSVQATSTGRLAGYDNHLVMGVSIDHGLTHFAGNSELGTVEPNLFVAGTGVFIDQPAADLTPVGLQANNTYTGVYATDTLDLTSKLSLTAGGRFNAAQIELFDETGTNPLLNGQNYYQRLNPVVGLTYRLAPHLTAYAGYSEANRAPTPLELGCSDPAHPCMIDTFLIADPPLKQVVAHTYEAGVRGTGAVGGGQMNWGLGVFRTEATDDIINVASAVVPMFGYFQNAATTLRRGLEAKASYGWRRWTAYANYTYVDATYQSAMTLQSPNNPAADMNGDIHVVPGDHIPAIPAHRFKAGFEYAVPGQWKVGANLSVFGSQYLIHDDSNQNPKVPPYWVVNLHGSYQLSKEIELFGLVQNLFDLHYYSAGTFFDNGGFNSNTLGAPNFLVLGDPRTFLPGAPLAVYVGARARF
jgi:iron complex outermembrane recepter protein